MDPGSARAQTPALHASMSEFSEEREMKKWTDGWTVHWLSRVPGRRRRGPLAALLSGETERDPLPRLDAVPRVRSARAGRESLEHRLGALPVSAGAASGSGVATSSASIPSSEPPVRSAPVRAAGVLVAVAGERSGEIHAFSAPAQLRDGSLLRIGESEFVFRSVDAVDPGTDRR
jgi:hypothetical protein